MNQFIVDKDVKLTPQQTVMGVMGITASQLIRMILENRGGQFDYLYKKSESRSAQVPNESSEN